MRALLLSIAIIFKELLAASSFPSALATNTFAPSAAHKRLLAPLPGSSTTVDSPPPSSSSSTTHFFHANHNIHDDDEDDNIFRDDDTYTPSHHEITIFDRAESMACQQQQQRPKVLNKQ